MAQRRLRTAVGKVNSTPERGVPGSVGTPRTPRSPRSPPRDELRAATGGRGAGDGMPAAAISPYAPLSPQSGSQRRAGAPKLPAPGGSLPATPRSVPPTPRGEEGTRVLTLDAGGHGVPALRLPPADAARSRPRTHASGSEDVGPELRRSPAASRRRSGGSSAISGQGWARGPDWKETRIGELKQKFLSKAETRRASYQDIFRGADIHKNGSLGREELGHALDQAGFKAEPEVLDHLLTTRARDRERLSFHDFMRFFDDRASNACLFKRKPGAQQMGDCAKMTHLWVPTQSDVIGGPQVGTLNDVLESDKREDGLICQKLDGNFSGARYNILSFEEEKRPVPPTVICPVQKRATLYDFPSPGGRRVSYDHGDSPWNVVSVRTPRASKRTSLMGDGINDNAVGADTWRRQTLTTNVPVRLHAFTRMHTGSLPSQGGMVLGLMTPVVV